MICNLTYTLCLLQMEKPMKILDKMTLAGITPNETHTNNPIIIHGLAWVIPARHSSSFTKLRNEGLSFRCIKKWEKKKRAVKWFRETIVYNILIDGYIYKLFIIIITEYGALPGGYLLCDECIYLVISLIQLMGLNRRSCLGGCWHYAINEIFNLTSVHIFHKCFIVRLGICR